MIDLPIDAFVAPIVESVGRARAVVVTAQPGAGKTTRVPPALADAGPVVLLQPRRVAARAIARRIAEERGWTLGREVGWHTRLDRRFTPDTRLLVATEGILTARLQHDPLLSDASTIVFDEYHERSIHADLGLALAKQAWRARADLRIVVMSATLDASVVARYLDDCPVIEVPGRLHPVTVEFAPGLSPAAAAAAVLQRTTGDVLCFLPGALEIRRVMSDLESRPGLGAEIVPLYGSLEAADQDRALRSGDTRRIVVATNIAETSVTVPNITGVVDAGTHKVARYDAERGVDSLEVERITQDAADQRAGRAGRTAPGLVVRLWDERDRLRPHREPEVHRIDLAGAALDIFGWGGHPRDLEWFERPRAEAIESAILLLARLGALDGPRLTALGRAMQRLPLHPRLARMLLAGRGSRRMARACAVISERHYLSLARGGPATASDLLSAVDQWAAVPPHVVRSAQDIERTALALADRAGSTPDITDEEFCRAVLAGYPDRVAQRRGSNGDRYKLSSGGGALLGAESGVRDAEYLVAVDVSKRPDQPDARIRVASRIEREWLRANRTDIVHTLDPSGVVRAVEIEAYDALTLRERPADPDRDEAARLLTAAWLAAGPSEADVQLLRRLRFAGHAETMDDLVQLAARRARRLADVKLETGLTAAQRARLDHDAPQAMAIPSGRSARLEYLEDGGVRADVKLQELFGLADTPRIGSRREPVLLALLGPNGRPVQLTRDLRSFWERTYPEVRKELRGRYPRHPWPDDPWSAPPTARTLRRK